MSAADIVSWSWCLYVRQQADGRLFHSCPKKHGMDMTLNSYSEQDTFQKNPVKHPSYIFSCLPIVECRDMSQNYNNIQLLWNKQVANCRFEKNVWNHLSRFVRFSCSVVFWCGFMNGSSLTERPQLCEPSTNRGMRVFLDRRRSQVCRHWGKA